MKIDRRNSIYGLRDFFLKRTADIGLILIALPVLIPLFSLIAIAIKLDSKGSVFFKQKRAGIDCIPFYCYKFRTMQANADESIHKKHIKDYISGKVDIRTDVKLLNDRRVTRMGKLLRKTSLDELPQLINVVKGEMSIVGPRPLPMYEVEEFSLWHNERFLAFPGITGYWQVNGRGRVAFDDQLRMDIRYIRNWSIWLDLKLIILTIPAVIFAKGAG
ncbi:MAG: sugar transferase [Leptolinea sp.]|nr:sugar transferase [Leptolinea sp.]